MFTEYRGTARQTIALNDFAEDLFQGRLAALAYKSNGNPDSAEQVASNINEIIRDVEARAEVFETNPAALAQIKSYLGDLNEYQATFERTRVLQTQIVELEETLAQTGLAARKNLTEIMTSAYEDGDPEASFYAGRAQEQLMLARFYMARYLVTKDVANFDNAMARSDEASGQMTTMRAALQNPRRRELSDELLQQFESFRSDAALLRERVVEQLTLRDNTLDVIGPKLQTGFEELVEGVVDRQNILGPQASGAFALAELILFAASAFTLIAGAAVAYVIGSQLSGAMSGMAASMKRLSEGDFALSIDGADRQNEIGEMARALEVFKASGLERERLERDQAAAAEEERRRAQAASALQSELGAVVAAAVRGDFSKRIESRFEDKSLTELADGVNELVQSVDTGVTETKRIVDRLAGGDLTEKMTGDFRGSFADLQTGVNATVDQLSSLVADIQARASSMQHGTKAISSDASELAGRAESQASSLEETAATMEEMTATIKANAESAQQASTTSAQAASKATRGGEVVQETVSAMSRIEEGSAKISDIISVIDSIAFQTNLLALNAAVEAARAGDAGKGFAVVASEVRTLAQRSADAAKDITQLISESTRQVSEGVELVNRTGEALREIVESVEAVTGTVEQISSATKEQSSGVEEISASVSHMDQMTQQNSAMAEASASAAKKLENQSGELTDLVAFFKVAGGSRESRDDANGRQPPSKPRQISRSTRPNWSAPPPLVVTGLISSAEKQVPGCTERLGVCLIVHEGLIRGGGHWIEAASCLPEHELMLPAATNNSIFPDPLASYSQNAFP